MEYVKYYLYTPHLLMEGGHEPALRCCSADHTEERLVPHFCALCTSNNLGGQSKDKHLHELVLHLPLLFSSFF